MNIEEILDYLKEFAYKCELEEIYLNKKRIIQLLDYITNLQAINMWIKKLEEKDKEIERLTNIIDELENFIKTYAIPEFNLSEEPTRYFMETKIILDKLKELKESK